MTARPKWSSHANVNCSDLDASVEWYRNALGLAAAPNRVVHALSDAPAPVTVELLEPGLR